MAGLLHPDLAGDPAQQLVLIAQSHAWRAIHWMFLFGFPLALTGLVGVLDVSVSTPGESAARAGVFVAAFAYAAWLVIVAFMVGTGWSLAQRFVATAPGSAATDAVALYAALHPFALAAQRLAGFALGLATALFGWGVVEGRVLPRWLGTGGVAAGVVGVVLALTFREDTKADEAAFVLPVVWQVVTGVVLLQRARSAAGA
ncbi:MAG TPA: hypothetical protein VH158_04035 [Gemmatimonadales bacterium]|nr:hypothetical protein [Gemmatimonadales bacterium]